MNEGNTTERYSFNCLSLIIGLLLSAESHSVVYSVSAVVTVDPFFGSSSFIAVIYTEIYCFSLSSETDSKLRNLTLEVTSTIQKEGKR